MSSGPIWWVDSGIWWMCLPSALARSKRVLVCASHSLVALAARPVPPASTAPDEPSGIPDRCCQAVVPDGTPVWLPNLHGAPTGVAPLVGLGCGQAFASGPASILQGGGEVNGWHVWVWPTFPYTWGSQTSHSTPRVRVHVSWIVGQRAHTKKPFGGRMGKNYAREDSALARVHHGPRWGHRESVVVWVWGSQCVEIRIQGTEATPVPFLGSVKTPPGWQGGCSLVVQQRARQGHFWVWCGLLVG
mmetsp:Transcript_143590/g.250627  ORF Transcript_143590/g.250627 Transcript_143590/m.250627 type:complete len:245 (-) Transcript_143590:351-1085(-)